MTWLVGGLMFENLGVTKMFLLLSSAPLHGAQSRLRRHGDAHLVKSAPLCCSKSSDDSLPSSLLCLRALPLCGAEYQGLPSRWPCSKIRLPSCLLWVSALPSSLASLPWTSFPSLCFLILHVVSRLPRVAPGALHELDLSHLLGLFLAG